MVLLSVNDVSKAFVMKSVLENVNLTLPVSYTHLTLPTITRV